MATARVAGTVKMKDDDIHTINASLVTTKPIVIPPFGCKQVKQLIQLLAIHSY